MNATASCTAPSRSAFVAGRDLKVGLSYRCIATGVGTVVDGDTYLRGGQVSL